MGRWAARSRYVGRNLLGSHAWLEPLSWIQPALRGNQVTDDTDVCIEGYPRSGNTFATVALRHWNPTVAIASHHHAPGQVARAVSRNVPTLVVVRPPVDAVTSQLVGVPELTAGVCLWAYVRFHSRVWELRDRVTVATFDQVTGRYWDVVARFSAEHGLGLASAPLSDEERTQLFHTIKWLNKIDPRQDERMAARPSEARKAHQDEVRPSVAAHPRLSEAQGWYERFAALATGPGG